MPPPPRAGRAPRIPPIFLSLKIDPLKLLTLAVGGRRHVVLPQEVAKLLPKGKLMKEVRARWRDGAFAEGGGGARAVPMAGKAGRGRGLRLPYALQAACEGSPKVKILSGDVFVRRKAWRLAEAPRLADMGHPLFWRATWAERLRGTHARRQPCGRMGLPNCSPI